jgi:hypothetical protein
MCLVFVCCQLPNEQTSIQTTTRHPVQLTNKHPPETRAHQDESSQEKSIARRYFFKRRFVSLLCSCVSFFHVWFLFVSFISSSCPFNYACVLAFLGSPCRPNHLLVQLGELAAPSTRGRYRQLASNLTLNGAFVSVPGARSHSSPDSNEVSAPFCSREFDLLFLLFEPSCSSLASVFLNA